MQEIPHQRDMFTGELRDTRTATQKQRDRRQELPQPIEMFSQREIAQFGVNAHPLLTIGDNTKLALQREDPRTDEEKERDLRRAAEAQNYPLNFEANSAEDLGFDEELYLFQQAVLWGFLLQ
jgi:hypothetical protein